MTNGQNNASYPDDQFQSVQGSAYLNRTLLDAIQATDVGWWGPWSEQKVARHKGSIELTSPDAVSATCALLVSNAPQQPYNGYQVTITGSVTTGDKLTITITSPSFSQGQISATYTVKAGDTTTTIATGLATAINALITGTVDSPVVPTVPPYEDTNISFPIPIGVTPQQQGYAGSLDVTTSANVITIAWRLPDYFTVSESKSTGATESMAVSQYDDGSGSSPTGLNSLTATGITAFDCPGSWIKGKCGTYSTGHITMNLVGVMP